MRVRNIALPLLVCAALLLAACGGATTTSGSTLPHGDYAVPGGPSVPSPGTPPGGGGDPPSFPELTGGVLVTIDTAGEVWQWWVTNPQTISYLEQAWSGTFIGGFNGLLRDGPGAADHNAPWSWHVDPDVNGHVVVASFAPPGTGWPTKPSQCESNLAMYIQNGSRFAARPFTILVFDDRRP